MVAHGSGGRGCFCFGVTVVAAVLEGTLRLSVVTCMLPDMEAPNVKAGPELTRWDLDHLPRGPYGVSVVTVCSGASG